MQTDHRDKYQQFEFADTTPVKTRRIPWKLVIALAFAAALAAGAYAWFFERDRVMPLLEGTPLQKVTPTAKHIYKWQGPDGTWNMTDRPPPEGIPYEQLR